MLRIKKISLVVLINVFAMSAFSQIVGETNPDTGEPSYTYSYTSTNLLILPTWVITGGSVLTQTSAGSSPITYTATVKFNTAGSGSVVLKRSNNSTVYATLDVNIVTPPVAPTSTLNYLNGSTVVTSPITSGITYYWQTTATGKSTSDASASKTVTVSGSTLYLRARNAFGNWSTTATTINVFVILTNIPSPSAPFYNIGSGQLVLTTSAGTVDKWQRRPAGGTWVDIASSAGLTTINYSGIDENTEFKALLTAGTITGISSMIATINVIQQGFEGTVTGPSNYYGTSSSGTLQLTNYSGTIVNWQSSVDGTSAWSDIAGSTSSTFNINLTNVTTAGYLYYRVKLTKKSTTSFSPAFMISWYPPITTNIASANYLLTEAIRIKESNIANISNLTTAQKLSMYTYTDGLSRPVQTVTKAASTTQKDVVGFAVYDALGRQSRSYLPYTGTGNNYYTNYLTEQATFYNGSTSKVTGDAYPFADVVFDGSPFNLVIEQGAPGASWQVGPTHNTIRSLSRSNTASEVRIWKTDGTSPKFYDANTLSVTEITDENGNKIITFTDKRGKVVQKHVQSGATTWLKTINIYDVAGRLIYTLQPEGVRQLGTGTTISAALLTKYAFKYTYDTWGRLAEKKVPDASAPVYIVYDPLQRPVLVQDGNLRASNKWAFIKYDLKNRPVMSGLYTHNALVTQAAMQTIMDGLYTAANASYPASAYYEDRGATLHGYTNVSFPKINGTSTAIEVLKVNFYDDYDFDDADTTPDYSYVSQGMPGETEQFQGPSQGLPTGSKQLILGKTTWLYNYTFYDQYGRTIQSIANNHLSVAVDNVMSTATTVYDFEGKVKYSKAYHHAGGTKPDITVYNKYDYDASGRLYQVSQSNNGTITNGVISNLQLVAQYEYNELGQLVDKKLHYTGSEFIQSIDYRYNIRGWLNSINNAQLSVDATNNDETNDFFGMEFLYNTTETALGNGTYYNGNISATKWKGFGTASGTPDQSSYKYSYDKADRLLSATSQMYTGSAWTKEAGVFNETLTYDDNGNIKTLQRNQRKYSTTTTYIAETIDNLTYTYASGNALSKVEDAVAYVTGQTGFNNGSTSTTEYTYNTNGSLTADLNKTISSIVYNVLNKPEQIIFNDGHKIIYTYDASGNKLTVVTYDTNNQPVTTTDYVGSFVYEGNALSFFSSPEGRVVNKNNVLEYQYSISDNQGNTRIVFSSAAPVTDAPLATFGGGTDTNDKTSQYLNVSSNIVPFGSANHSAIGTNVVRMNQTNNIGPAKSVHVFPGDKVAMEVWEYHEGSSGYGTTSTPINSLVTALSTIFTAGVSTGEATMINNGLNGAFTTYGSGGGLGDTQPAAYLNYILFDKNYNVLDMGWKAVPAVTFNKQQVSLNPITVKEEGFVYIYLSYEDNSNNYVHFDDFKVTYIPTNIIQSNEYYPFGLQTSKSWTRENSKNNFLYDGGMELNPSTGWYDLAYRNYDPVLGRLMQVDPMAEKYAGLSPYNYAFNDPVGVNDPGGADPIQDEYDRISYNVSMGIPYMDGYGAGIDVGGGSFGGMTSGEFAAWSTYGMFPSAAAFFARLAAYGAHWSFGNTDYSGVIAAGNAILGEQANSRALLHAAQNGDPAALQEYGQQYGLERKSNEWLKIFSHLVIPNANLSISPNELLADATDPSKKIVVQAQKGPLWDTDGDGILSLHEANLWYQHGVGQEIHVDASKIDLRNVNPKDFKNNRTSKNLLFEGPLNVGIVYGRLDFISLGDNKVKIVDNVYDFSNEGHSWWNEPIRNLATIIGGAWAGDGTPYNIVFDGTANLTYDQYHRDEEPIIGLGL